MWQSPSLRQSPSLGQSPSLKRFALFGPLCPHLAPFCSVWPRLAPFEPIWPGLALFSPFYPFLAPTPPPTNPSTPGKVEMQLEIDHILPVGRWWICFVIGVSLEWHWIEKVHPNILYLKLTKYSWWKLSLWLMWDLRQLEFTVITGQFGLLCRQICKVSKQVSMQESGNGCSQVLAKLGPACLTHCFVFCLLVNLTCHPLS